MTYDNLSPYLMASVLFGGFAALAYYWRSYPFQMLYHKTGIPHQVGIVTAVHHEEKRLRTLMDSVNEMERLLRNDYHIVVVSCGPARFMVERQYGTVEVKIYCDGAFSEIYADLVKRVPSHLRVDT